VSYGSALISHIWPIILYLVLVAGLIGTMLVPPYFLGSRRHARATGQPFESGIIPSQSTQYRIPIPFYLFAIFFVVFDLEAAFLFVWSVSIREAGWSGLVEAFVFITILIVALIYLWRLGALDWRTQRQKRDRLAVIKER